MEPNLNEIIIMPIAAANTSILVSSELYNIESNNSNEVRSQSVSTDDGNEHTITKTSDESLIATKIPTGELAVLAANTTNESQESTFLARAFFF